MSYNLISNYRSPNFGYPQGTRGQNDPDKIIIHHWGNDGQKFENVVNWLCNPAAEVSAHYVVEAGRAAILCNYQDATWNAGNSWANRTSISIECRPECSAQDFQTVAEVIADVWKAYGRKLPLKGHKDFAATACPGRYYNRLAELYNKAEIIYNGGKPTPPPTPPKDVLDVDGVAGPATIKALQKFLRCPEDGVISGQLYNYRGYWPNISSINYGNGGSYCVKQLQLFLSRQGFPAYDDGLLGPSTIKALQRFMNKWWGASINIDGVAGYYTIWYLQRYLNFKLYGV